MMQDETQLLREENAVFREEFLKTIELRREDDNVRFNSN